MKVKVISTYLLSAKITDIEVVDALIFALRKVLSRQSKAIVELTLKLGLIPVLDKLISCEFPNIHMNAIWCLINLAAGARETVQEMINLEIHKKVLKLINVANEPSLEDVAFASPLVRVAAGKH